MQVLRTRRLRRTIDECKKFFHEIKLLFEYYEYKKVQLDFVIEVLIYLCKKVPESDQMFVVKGIGVSR